MKVIIDTEKKEVTMLDSNININDMMNQLDALLGYTLDSYTLIPYKEYITEYKEIPKYIPSSKPFPPFNGPYCSNINSIKNANDLKNRSSAK